MIDFSELNHAHAHFAHKWTRKNSFDSWPPSILIPPPMLYGAGFFYSQCDDTVTCFSCGKNANKWLQHHDPWIRHALGSPHCPYLRFRKGTKFIKDAFEAQKLSNQEPDLSR